MLETDPVGGEEEGGYPNQEHLSHADDVGNDGILRVLHGRKEEGLGQGKVVLFDVTTATAGCVVK